MALRKNLRRVSLSNIQRGANSSPFMAGKVIMTPQRAHQSPTNLTLCFAGKIFVSLHIMSANGLREIIAHVKTHIFRYQNANVIEKRGGTL